MDDNNYHYLEDIIFNKGRQIVCVEKKYMNMQTKSGHLSKLLGALVFIPSLFLIANVHYILFLNFGLPSLFITPASAMVLALLTGIGAKIGERIYAGKIGKCEEMIQRLKEETDKYQKQLE